MEYILLPKIDKQIENYQHDHKGEMPLYIMISSDESKRLMEEVKHIEGHSSDITVTTFKGIKIMPNDLLKQGEIRLSNELPETSS